MAITLPGAAQNAPLSVSNDCNSSNQHCSTLDMQGPDTSATPAPVHSDVSKNDETQDRPRRPTLDPDKWRERRLRKSLTAQGNPDSTKSDETRDRPQRPALDPAKYHLS